MYYDMHLLYLLPYPLVLRTSGSCRVQCQHRCPQGASAWSGQGGPLPWLPTPRIAKLYMYITSPVAIYFLQLLGNDDVIYEVITRKFRASVEPFWDLKISIYDAYIQRIQKLYGAVEFVSCDWKLTVLRLRVNLRLCDWGAGIDVAWTCTLCTHYIDDLLPYNLMQLLGMWSSFSFII